MNKSIYIKPIIIFEETEPDDFMADSRPSTQCHCYEHNVNDGCRGCTDNCGCNHWDSELGQIIPGC